MTNKDHKFQLLEFSPINFSLTEGTDIPPPPEEPAEEPRPPTPARGPLSSHPTTPRIGAFPTDPLQNGSDALASSLAKVAQEPEHPPLLKPSSPPASKRPSSVRRFLGLRSHTSSDTASADHSGKNRPMSPQSMHTQTSATTNTHSLQRKKSTSWFGKRKSMVYVAKVDEQPVEEKENHDIQPKGPPPPTIPEFTSLGAVLDGGDLGADDLFKNIK